MFRRANNGQNQNQNQNRNQNPKIHEEKKAENGGIGNEALVNLVENELNLSHSNEENNKEFGNYIDNNIGNDFSDDADKENNGPDIKIDKEFIEDAKEVKEEVEKEENKRENPGRDANADHPKNDIGPVNNDMQNADGWDFQAVKMAERKKPSFFSKLKSWAAFYGGKAVGTVGGILGTVFNLVTFGAFTGINSWAGLARETFPNKDDYQDKRHRSNIPGWDGAKFEKRRDSEDEVKVDFRRIPDIWSYPIAEAATDSEGNAKDPIISVYIKQASRDMTATERGTGHAGIGIEYSRRNGATGKWQRYSLRYGFYMVGGLPKLSQASVLNYNNATIPGQLMPEKEEQYHISRSFKVSAKQVNDVLKASERWADRGYNVYTRNCTTFAKEMIVDAAHINQAESIFAKDEISLPASMDAKMFGAGVMAPLFKQNMENAMEKLAHKDDLSYQGHGNKMFSKKDYARYKNSLSWVSLRSNEAFSPNGSAENIRRLEGEDTGEIGSFTTFKDVNDKNVARPDINMIHESLMSKAFSLPILLRQITPAEQMQNGEIPAELNRIIRSLDKLHKPLSGLLDIDEDLLSIKSEKLSAVRTKLNAEISDLNTLLFRYYKNDKRLSEPVLETISLIQHAIKKIDEAYRDRLETGEEEPQDEDLGTLRNDFYNLNYDMKSNSKKVLMTPSKYEAYLQIYKTPKAAIENYSKYLKLRNKNKSTLNENELKKLQKFARLDALSEDFGKAHRYMMDKKDYNQQDIDYAFALENKEQNNDENDNTVIKNTMFEDNGASASVTYQMLIMQKIFGGMKNRFQRNGDQDVMDYLQNDIINCIDQKQNEMKKVIRGIKRSMKDPDEKKVREKVLEKIQSWVIRVMKDDLDKDDILLMNVLFSNMNEELPGRIQSMTQEIMDEDKKPA